MKHLPNLIIMLSLFFAGCTPASFAPGTDSASETSHSLTVFAAASLTDAFIEIAAKFESASPGVDITLNFAGSQALRTQIEEGAPADVFASANAEQMDALVTSGFITQGVPQVFLSNSLVIIVPKDNPAGVNSVEDLAKPGLKLVLAAEEVPVGKYSRDAFDLMDRKFGNNFKDKLLANVVSNEDNVRQVVAKVQLGEADAGVVYTSDAVAAPELPTIVIPARINVIAEYPIATLTESANPELANAFVDYVLSSDGQALLQKWGFRSIP